MLLFALITTAAAYETIGATWPDDAFPIPWWISSDLGSLDDEAAVEAIQAGFAVWEEPDCAEVRFAYQGRVDEDTFGETDGRNVVYFFEEGWPDEASLVSAPVLALAGSRIVEADLALNGQYFAWSTESADGASLFDVQSAISHEVGHWLGLWHTAVQGATLNPSMDGHPDGRTLEDDDVAGLCALYRASAGEGAIGDDCVESDDCGEELFCLADGVDRYCTTACEADADCPADWACFELGDQTACAIAETGCGGCASGRGEPAKLPRGAWWFLAPMGLLYAGSARSKKRSSRWKSGAGPGTAAQAR